MNALEAKQKVTEILGAVIHHDPRYWREDEWIRWETIRKDLHAIIDEVQASPNEEPLAANRSRPAIQPTSITGRRVKSVDKLEYPQRSE